jgi:membrane protein DedA with SNARE-associated domain
MIESLLHWMHGIGEWGIHLLQDWGYWGIILLMAMESSIFPVPSELVMPPAAFLAAQGKLDFWGVVAAGTFGSWLGSAITYFVALWAGRPLMLRFGKYIFCPPEKFERAERFLTRYQAGGIFFARLLPVVRHLISIPAGIVRMGFAKFSVLTTVGAGIWCWFLSWYGQGIFQRHPELADLKNADALKSAVKGEIVWVIAIVAGLCLLYFLMLKLTAAKKED